MTVEELLKEWEEALQDYKENYQDWNCYFYALELKEKLNNYGISTEAI